MKVGARVVRLKDNKYYVRFEQGKIPEARLSEKSIFTVIVEQKEEMGKKLKVRGLFEEIEILIWKQAPLYGIKHISK